MSNCPRLIKDESGVALITGLLILMSLTAIGVFATNVTRVNQDISANLKASKQELYLAEAGIWHAKQFLKQNINDWQTYGTTGPLTIIGASQVPGDTYHVGTYTVTIQSAGGPGGQGRRVLSTGTTSPTGNTSSAGKAVAEALFGNNPRFPCAFCSQADITLKGGAVTDSFDSRLGSYAQTKSSHGDVVANGNVAISGNNTTVKGDATAGGTVSAGAGQVTGTITNHAPLQYFPPVAACGPPYSSGAGISPAGVYNSSTGLLQSSGAAIVLAPGPYCFNNVQITGQGTLTVQGLVGCTNCGVQVYLTADSTFSGHGIINLTQAAVNLRIFSSVSSGNQGITLAGGSLAYASVYAPNAYVKFTGGSDFYGSAVGGGPAGTTTGGIDDTGGTNIHYDLALNGLANSGLGLLTWRQVF